MSVPFTPPSRFTKIRSHNADAYVDLDQVAAVKEHSSDDGYDIYLRSGSCVQIYPDIKPYTTFQEFLKLINCTQSTETGSST